MGQLSLGKLNTQKTPQARKCRRVRGRAQDGPGRSGPSGGGRESSRWCWGLGKCKGSGLIEAQGHVPGNSTGRRWCRVSAVTVCVALYPVAKCMAKGETGSTVVLYITSLLFATVTIENIVNRLIRMSGM